MSDSMSDQVIMEFTIATAACHPFSILALEVMDLILVGRLAYTYFLFAYQLCYTGLVISVQILRRQTAVKSIKPDLKASLHNWCKFMCAFKSK